MATPSERFAALVARLEQQARRNPAAYRLRVVALAFAGYAYLGAVFALILSLVGLGFSSLVDPTVLAAMLALLLAALTGLARRAMRVDLPAPRGCALERGEAPELFALIAGLRGRLRAPRLHRVVVTGDFNASITQLPRLGVPGLHRNILAIGLPLMKSLSPEQFRAVLAHEIGHLAGGHGRIASGIYRLRSSWARLLETLDRRKTWGSLLLRPFFERYVPYFNAYSLPLARAHEYQADAMAVRLTSRRATAEALSTVSVIGSYLGERFWPILHRKADELPRPAFAPFSGMGNVIPWIEEKSAHAWLARALARPTGAEDTHPALVDRLRAIGATPRLALPAPGEAADRMLGEAHTRIAQELDRRWRRTIRPSWEKRYRAVQESRARFAGNIRALEACDARQGDAGTGYRG